MSEQGADGFRIDVAHGLAKDLDRDDLDDYPVLMQLPADGSHPLFDRNEVHDIYREWRTVFNEYTPHRFAVAEAWVNPDRQYLYASEDELGQIFNFEFAKADWSRNQFHTAIEEGLAASRRAYSPATWVLSNHDIPRHATRFALPQVPSANYHQFAADWILRGGKTYAENREAGTQRSRAAIMMEMALPGSAYIYQGEELGLFEVPDIPWDRLEDPVAFNTRHSELNKGRDGCRVPLPWTADRLPGSQDPFGFPPHTAPQPLICPSPHGSRILLWTAKSRTVHQCSISTAVCSVSAISCNALTPPLNGLMKICRAAGLTAQTGLREASSPTDARMAGHR